MSEKLFKHININAKSILGNSVDCFVYYCLIVYELGWIL